MNEMTGKLYGVGIGPGDPELITIKGRRILGEADVIAVPKSGAEKASRALEIAGDAVGGGKEILELLFPMSHDGEVLAKSRELASAQIRERLDKGCDVAFITLGDPTVYSTYMHVHKELERQGYATEIIPGITSFCASAARAGISLGENSEAIAVIPSAYESEHLEAVLDSFENIVFMKASRSLAALAASLESRGLLDKSVLVTDCGMEDERVEYDWPLLKEDKISYFSTVLVKKSGVR
jgi:precorrin-2/cobalt-factor-2 C20-methyltransferase